MKPLALLLSLVALGCAAEDSSNDISKDEARARVGKGDVALDYCEWLGWYGDGECDDFCLEPDPDCGTSGDQYCYADEHCGPDERCNADEVCLSPCEAGVVCTQVCSGFCVADEPDSCWGAWVDPATGACRAPNDGIYPEECCAAELSICGGFSNTPCNDDEWCDFGNPPEGSASSMTGLCKPRPSSCYELYAPVCGNDGNGYSNDCFAHAAGTDVAYEGECQ